MRDTFKSHYFLVLFPKLLEYFSESFFLSEGFKFFIKVIEDLLEQRANSTEVKRITFPLFCIIYAILIKRLWRYYR